VCQQTIILSNGNALTGRLVEHLGNGRAGVDVDGKRFTGTKVELVRAERRPRC
jgi:hypothetical protein